MTLSMTAFARCEQRDERGELVWELRSVNHRYLETQLRLPDELRQIEASVRERLAARLSRGKLDCFLRYRPEVASQGAIQVNAAVVEQLLGAVDTLARRLGGDSRYPTLMEVLNWPGVVEQHRPDLTPVVEQALSLLERTLDELIATRRREGERLDQLILQRCAALRAQVALVRERMPQVLAGLRRRLRERIEEISAGLEPGRLEQEMALLVQRLDVDEEMDRLLTHLGEVEAVVKGDGPVGRRLDFLMQELNREANTLSSKSTDVEVTRAGVEMKVLIEQMREQIQNLE